MKQDNRTLAKKVATDALANIGVEEDGEDNHGKYVAIYLKSVGLEEGNAWCAAFAHYRYDSASKATGIKLPSGFPVSGWVPDYVVWAKKNKRWIPVDTAKATIDGRPQEGDLLCFWFKDKDRHAHIGIVVGESDARGCWCVEGNTNDGDPNTVERNGGGVYKRRRDWRTWGVEGGYIDMTVAPPKVKVTV